MRFARITFINHFGFLSSYLEILTTPYTMTDSTTKKIAIITGSTRAVRIGPQVTRFVQKILEEQLSISPNAIQFTLAEVDISSFELPVFDEEVIPATVPYMAQFAHEHSKAWSAEIAKYDGYVLVTACYVSKFSFPGRLRGGT